MFDHYSPLCFFFFFEVEISSSALIPPFMSRSVHSGSASLDDCGRMFSDKLRVMSSFLDRFPGHQHSQPTPTSLGQGCMRV